MNKSYKNKFVMWDVGDDGEEKIGEYDIFQEFLEHIPQYYKNSNMTYTFGCLSWLGPLSHIELRFKLTPLYSTRQSEYFNKK